MAYNQTLKNSLKDKKLTNQSQPTQSTYHLPTRTTRCPKHPVTHIENLTKKIDDVIGSVKWKLKKVNNLNVAAAIEKMYDEEIRQNVVMSLEFLAFLLKAVNIT